MGFYICQQIGCVFIRFGIEITQFLGRVVFLTTHFMDEADALGDRIGIMTGGRLQCCGTSFFLKKKFGLGYVLIMDKQPYCNPDSVTNLLKRHVSTISVSIKIEESV